MNDDVFTYRIDKQDTITYVSNSWQNFANKNGWYDLIGPDMVVGKCLWNFIQGVEIQGLYEELFKKVRIGKMIGPIPFRCDSPDQRRFLELILKPLPGNGIEIISTIVRTEYREPLNILNANESECISEQFLRICSMCKKIDIDKNNWVELEEGLSYLKIFEEDDMPLLTHGMCPMCYEVALANLV